MDGASLPGAGEPLEAEFLSGGTQNVIYKITRGEHACVLRMPPPDAPPDRDKGILREWRIIEALDGTEVPHTAAVGVCPDADVLGRPFYLMGFVDGWSPMDLEQRRWPAPFDSDAAARAGLSYQLAEGIALLSKVDWRAKGLQDLGRPDGFHERQVDRWTAFFERIKGRDIDGLDVATDWLRNHRPLDFIPGLMHGDYQFANVMYKHGAPAQLAAIVDWEMGTVGDPKLDLGWMVQSWPEDTSAPGESEMNYVDMREMPSRAEVVDHYAKVSGRQVDDLDYYLVLAKWKLAIVLEQGFQRAGDNEKLRAYGPVIVSLMRSAADLAESSDYR
ncbi:phosphotransferase family protein [Mycobacterium deserti]